MYKYELFFYKRVARLVKLLLIYYRNRLDNISISLNAQ